MAGIYVLYVDFIGTVFTDHFFFIAPCRILKSNSADGCEMTTIDEQTVILEMFHTKNQFHGQMSRPFQCEILASIIQLVIENWILNYLLTGFRIAMN